MLLVPSATRVQSTDIGADDLLRRLTALLPDSWIVAGAVAAKPVSDSCRRGHTRPFDAIIIGNRMIFVLDIWSPCGLIANRRKSALFARIHDESDIPEGWQSFRREIEKLKATLHDRFEVEPGRIVPDKIWNRAQWFGPAEAAAAVDTADLRSFARAATRADKASSFPPMRRKTVERIATFLTDEAKAAPEPAPILYFTDVGPMPAAARRTPAAPATPAPIAAHGDAPASPALEAATPVVAKAAEAAAAAPVRPSHPAQAELLLQQEAPIAPPATPASIAAPSPSLDAALPVVAKAAEAAAPAPARPSHPTQADISRPPAAPIASPPTPAPIARPEEAPEPTSTEEKAPAPLVMDVVKPAAARPADASFDRALPATPASITLPEKALRPAPATMAAAAPVIAKAARSPAAAHRTDADASLEQAARSVAFAPAQRRPTAQWTWLAGLLLLLLVSQAGTIAWLALFPASPRLEPAAPAAPAAPAPAAPIPVTIVVRSLATSEPMLVGSETVTLRAGPSSDFPAVGALDAGTEVVASARADGPDGSSWIEITAANGAIGFVPDDMVQPEPAPALAIEYAAPPKEMPTPKAERAAIKRAAAPKQAPTAKIERAVASKQTPSPKAQRVVAAKQTPTPKVQRAVAAKQTPTPKVQRAVASKQTPPPKIIRATEPAQRSRPKAVPAAPPGVACILPGGEEIQATRSDCRARSGIIYQ